MESRWKQAGALAAAAAMFCSCQAPEGGSDSFGGGPEDGSETATNGGDDGSAGDGASTGDGGEADDGGSDDGFVFDTATNDDLPPDGNAIPTTCAMAEAAESSVGCEFYTVELDRGEDEFIFGVSVHNVQLEDDATVTIEKRVDGVWEVIDERALEPGDVETFEPELPLQSGSGRVVGAAARIRSDRPIVAYQFSPLELEETVYSSDASMLLPVEAWDYEYRALNWGGSCSIFSLDPYSEGPRAYITVVANSDDTPVVITPSVETAAGPGVAKGGPDQPIEVLLQAGDAVEVAAQYWKASMSGTRVSVPEDKTVAVFTGHQCANAPAVSGACDHLEEQLSGVHQWGKSFAVIRPMPRWKFPADPFIVQVLAAEDETSVEFLSDDSLWGVPDGPVELGQGEVLEFLVEPTNPAVIGDFVLEADKPVSVATLMTGSLLGECPFFTIESDFKYGGDPAMTVLSSAEQSLPRVSLLSPEGWDHDGLTIARRSGAVTYLDGAELEDVEFDPIGGGWEVAHVEVSDGSHSVESDQGVLVLASGYSSYDSYAYMGGVGAQLINPPAG